jgi:dissimilatory sulfite reductase related protein
MATKVYAGKTLEIDANGNLKDMNQWSEDIARDIAKEEGINELTERHWLIINFMRKVYKEKGDAPSLRKLTAESGVSTKELYALFPKGPAKKAAKIAGLPKPTGCI